MQYYLLSSKSYKKHYGTRPQVFPLFFRYLLKVNLTHLL